MKQCRICQRNLTAKKSVKLGFGRVCFRRLRLGYSGVQLSSEFGKETKELEEIIRVNTSRKT